MIRLTEVPLNTPCTVVSLDEGSLTVRLMELGIIPGVNLEILFTAPGGCPIAVFIGGTYLLGLRKEESDLVTVRIFN